MISIIDFSQQRRKIGSEFPDAQTSDLFTDLMRKQNCILWSRHSNDWVKKVFRERSSVSNHGFHVYWLTFYMHVCAYEYSASNDLEYISQVCGIFVSREGEGESEWAKVKMDLWIAQFISLITSLYSTFSWMHKDFEYTCFMFKHFFGIRSSYWERKEIMNLKSNAKFK